MTSGRTLVNGDDIYIGNSDNLLTKLARASVDIPEVINSLLSTSTTAALSANQGRRLNSRLELSLYYNTSSLGVDLHTCTLKDLVLAIPNYSILYASLSGVGDNPNKPFPTSYGTITCFKLDPTRMLLYCSNNQSGGLWCGTYYYLSSANIDSWSGWMIAGCITHGTSSSPSLDIDGLIYLQYE